MSTLKIEKTTVAAIATSALLMSAVVAVPFMASASIVLNPFTAGEIATWTEDRTFPSGGVDSVSFADRDDVLELRIDSDNRSDQSSFYYTEGIKKEADFGTELSADLYLDPAWEEIDVRAGLWGVAVDASSTITSYPIIEFSTTRDDDSTGWRVWDEDAWVNLDTDFEFGTWNDLTMTIGDDAINFFINGEEVGSTTLNGSESFDAVIINSYNYGSTSESYAAHWHAGVEEDEEPTDPTVKQDCFDGGWEELGFKNQGQCVRFVETGKDSR